MKKLIAIGLAIGCVTGFSARADIIFDNGGAVENPPGLVSTAGSTIIADDFVLDTGLNSITDVHWWGAYRAADTTNATPWADSFTLNVFADSSGSVGSLLHTLNPTGVTRTQTALVNSRGQDIYSYDVFLDSPLTLTANDTYWLSITNVGNGSETWVWANSAGLGDAVFSLPTDSSWTSISRNMAFNLTNDAADAPVPEPATVSLLGMGLVGLAVRARRRAKG